MGTTPEAVARSAGPRWNLVCMRSVSQEGIRRSLGKGRISAPRLADVCGMLREGRDQILFAGVEQNLAEQDLVAGVEPAGS